jgi:beta-glucanase (GH16 family)
MLPRALILLFACAESVVARDMTGWQLVWADEFEGPAKSPVDPAKWSYDLGNGAPRNPGWGNHEKQDYTDSTDNVFLDGHGHLIIQAVRTADGSFTSGRIKTQGKFEFEYGRVMARIKTTYAQGIWEAFWLLGASYRTTAWPICGEIDVMEVFGAQNHDPSASRGTLHGPGYANTGISEKFTLPDKRRLSDDFHVFSIDWQRDSVEFFVDGNSYLTVTPAKLPADSHWVFNAPFFLMLNVAVGGYPAPVGYPDDTTTFPVQMLVDYVRVYQR